MLFFLLLETGMLGVFLATDLVLFYIFWEFTLVPMYFLIGMWGGERRVYAAVKFFLFTMAGSLLMLLAILLYGADRRHLLPARAARQARSISPMRQFGSSSPLPLHLPSRCPCGPSIPGCPMLTWKPPPPAR